MFHMHNSWLFYLFFNNTFIKIPFFILVKVVVVVVWMRVITALYTKVKLHKVESVSKVIFIAKWISKEMNN